MPGTVRRCLESWLFTLLQFGRTTLKVRASIRRLERMRNVEILKKIWLNQEFGFRSMCYLFYHSFLRDLSPFFSCFFLYPFRLSSLIYTCTNNFIWRLLGASISWTVVHHWIELMILKISMNELRDAWL